MQRYQSAHNVLESVREKLAAAATAAVLPGSHDVLQQVADLLSRGRGYSWIGIYLSVDSPAGAATGRVAQAESAADPGSPHFPESKSEMVVPIRIGMRTLGMIDVESGRAANLARQERVLLGQVAAALAQYLATDPGKLRRRQARNRTASDQPAARPQKGPQSASPERSRAAAGEHSTR